MLRPFFFAKESQTLDAGASCIMMPWESEC
jgi:hypothetical protein